VGSRCGALAHTHQIDCFGEAHGVRGMTIGELADQLEGIARVQKPWPEYLRMALLRACGRGRVEVWCTQNDQGAPKLADVIRVARSLRRSV
jgi:hypothetical protein